jgi:amino acid transporter
MSVVVVAFIVLALKYLYGGQGWAGLFSLQPLYDPKTFNSHKILTATSFAALTYIGFDGVTTLAEDVENPKRNVLLAVVLTCIFAGVCSGLEAYLGARVWPDWRSFPNLETAFMDICSRVGGVVLFNAMLNFGAFLAFMGVNLACFWQFSVRRQQGYKRRILQDAVLPLIGFLFCGLIWVNLNVIAKTVGGIWFAIGILYVGYKTNWFRSAPVMIDFRDS